MSERKAGWYWVKAHHGGKWGCFNWDGRAWRDSAGVYPESIFDVVGHRIPTPDEPWQCVPVEPTDEMAASVFWATCDSRILWTVWTDMLSAAPKPGEDL